ncbi:MAG: hypothetical protein AB8F26_01705 [Phycisphaerales bacterium]
MAKRRTKKTKDTSNASLGFEEKLWASADKLCGSIDAAEYKHLVVVLRTKILGVKSSIGKHPIWPRYRLVWSITLDAQIHLGSTKLHQSDTTIICKEADFLPMTNGAKLAVSPALV